IAPGHVYRDLNPLLLSLKNTLERSPSATAFTDHFTSPPPSTAASVISAVLSSSPSTSPAVKVSRSPYPLTYKVEDYVQLAAYAYFLQHGTLVPKAELPGGVTDEEYLGGVISFSNNDLPRYVVGRAIERDEESIGCCKDLVNELFEELSEFDFRNGPVRRKFDGVKYAVRKIENVLYELSVTDRASSGSEEPSPKKQKTASAVDKEGLVQIKGRFEAYDLTREDVIKRSREVQKAAKNSIFAMHRGNMKQADDLLETCVRVGNEIMKVIDVEPTLRQGAFSNSLEEYAEALLFKTWLTEGKVACMEDFAELAVNEDEFLGGLCDLSGEVGRVAVLKGTKRDREGVQGCLDTNLSVLYALEGLHLPGKLNKKMDPLRGSVKKLENVLYELSLIQAKGGGTVNTDSTTMNGEGE
ncbi:hypothetical protein TrRE_jg8380, partial [Triparma retinervis]